MKRKADGGLVAVPGTASDTQARFMDSGARPSSVVDLGTEVKFMMGQQGRCVVAKDHVKAEALVMEYSGEIIKAKEVPKRRKLYATQKVSEPFFLHFSPGYVIDATHTGNRSRFMTHSVSPNCQLQTWNVGADPKVYVLAVKDIAPGAELTYTVYQNCSLGQNVRCMCGAARCADSSANETPSPGTVRRSRQENEQMADAVIKCIQDFNFDLSYNLQAEKLHLHNQRPAQNAQMSRAALPLHARIPACPDSPHLVNSPSHGARESINALGLDSPDSFLDHLHTRTVQRHAPLPAQTRSVQQHAQPPVQTLTDIASRCAKLAQQLNDTPSEPPQTSTTQAKTAQPAAAGATKQSPLCPPNAAMLVASAPAPAQQLSRQLLNKPPLPQRTHGADLSRFAPSQAQPMMLGPAKQAGQQLQDHLIQYCGVLVGGYAMGAETHALEAAAPPYQRMLSLKTVLSQRLQAGQPTDPTSLLEEAGWKPCLQQSKKASLQHDAVGASAMLSSEMLRNAHSQQAADAALRRVCNTPDAFCVLDGGLPVLAAQSCPEQNIQALPPGALSSEPLCVAPAGPQMQAVQTTVPVASTLPLDEHVLSCSEHLVQSLGSQFPCSLKVPPEVHPYFQVSVPSHNAR